MSNPIYEKLHETKLSDFLNHKEVYTVKECDTIENVIQLLNQHGIHSCPVVSEDGVCVGVIDMLSIMKHIVMICPPQEGIKPYNLEVASRAISWKKVGDLIIEHGVPFVSLNETYKATHPLDVFSSKYGIHRSPILDSESKVVNTISQSDYVKWFFEQSKTYFKNFEPFDFKLTDLGMAETEVVTVNKFDMVIDVIKKMAEQDLYAVAVVNNDGELVGNFSANDLKAMCQENWPSFFVPVYEYLLQHSPTSLMANGLSIEYSTLRTALKYFGSYPQHRIWVVDSNKPVGVITHTDVLNFVRSYEYGAVAE